VKIATFNINDVRKRLHNLVSWLAAARPDVACLQELKCTDGAFPAAALQDAGYQAVWRGEKSWNGVAILARGRKPVQVRDALPGDPGDQQARYIEAAVEGVLIACLYAPNGNPQPGPKFAYKLAWMDRLHAHAQGLIDAGVPAVLAGDFNVTPAPVDVYPTRSYDDNALTQPAPREKYAALLAQGWTDAIRRFQPEGPAYTFWDYRRERWPRNAGLRLDHLLVAGDAVRRLTAAGIDREVRAADNASDHAPVWITLGKARGR
jgi:exodeoxyribonuclease-3